MRFRRASLAVVLLAAIGLCVTSTASSAAAQPVTVTADVQGDPVCSPPVQTGNVTRSHCENDELWSGDITGHGFYSYDLVENLKSGVLTYQNAVETIFVTDCVFLDPCVGELYARWNEQDIPTGSFHIEQSFLGGIGPFTNAHGSIRYNIADEEYQGRIGF
jgi:hypothetical protein